MIPQTTGRDVSVERTHAPGACPCDRTEATCSSGEQAGTIIASEEDESRKAGALFPREDGWLPGFGQARIGDPRQGEAAEEVAAG
jgi:hypothetical protein